MNHLHTLLWPGAAHLVLAPRARLHASLRSSRDPGGGARAADRGGGRRPTLAPQPCADGVPLDRGGGRTDGQGARSARQSGLPLVVARPPGGARTTTHWLGRDSDSRDSQSSGSRPGHDRATSAVMWGGPPRGLQAPVLYQGGHQTWGIDRQTNPRWYQSIWSVAHPTID